MRFEQDFIDNVRNSNSIVELISQYVPLKRKGANYMACCPFHNEKTPSFSVSEEKGIFKCFGCGIGGNIFTFYMKINNATFVEAVEELAKRANIAVPDISSSYDPILEKQKQTLYKINEIAAQFYHQRLYDSKVSKPAQDYVKKRHLNNKTLKQFKIGYSGGHNELYLYLKEQGFSEEDILQSWLVNKSEKGYFYDRYKNRLMFPIMDIRGRTIAFGGRVLDNSKPKYINSSDNIIYSKSNHLYGLNIAKNTKEEKILVVEGYMDVVSCHQRGIDNVVAVLGTALTNKHIYLLKNTKKQIVLSFDKDAARQNAIERSIDIARKMGLEPLILQLDKPAKDPDEYMQKYGELSFKTCINNAISVTEFRIKNLKQGLDLDTTKGKMEFLNGCASIISQIENELDKEIYIEKIARDYGVSKDALFSEVNKLGYEEPKMYQSIVTVPKVDLANVQKARKKLKKREYEIINILLQSNFEIYQVIKQLLPMPKDENIKEIIEKIYEQFEKTSICDNQLLLQNLSDEQASIVSEIIFNDQKVEDIEKGLDNIIISYKLEQLENEEQELREKLSSQKDNEVLEQTLKRIKDIAIEINELKNKR